MLTAEAAARRMTLTVRTLTRWRKEGRGPEWIRLGPEPEPGRRGGAIRYPAKKLDEWLNRHARRDESEKGGSLKGS